MFQQEEHGEVILLKLAYGKANTLDKELLAGFVDKLTELEQSSAAGVVLTGAGPMFSAGVDLFRVLEGKKSYLDQFLPRLTGALLRLFTFPKPVIAAANGHAIAGGCLLVCACDYRIMATGEGRIGAPELMVGVPFPSLPLEILRFVVPNNYFQEVIYTGQTYSAEQAVPRGLIDETVKVGDLLDRATEMAKRLAAIPSRSFQITKRLARQPVVDWYEKVRGVNDIEISETWASDAVYESIDAYLKKSIGQGKKS